MKRRPCPDMREHREAITAYVLPRIKEMPSGCWEWQRDRNSMGYGQGSFRGRGWIITRLLWCATMGAFDPKMDVCHTCDTPSCVNPTHLWIGSRSENIVDSVQKGRHFLHEMTHCKRGHPLAGDNLYVSYRGTQMHRACIICQRAKQRLAAGWPEDLAYSLPPQPLGYKPPGVALGGPKKRKGPKTHCVNGHPLSGDNLYIVPSDGRRQCRACKLAVTMRLSAERREMRQGNG